MRWEGDAISVAAVVLGVRVALATCLAIGLAEVACVNGLVRAALLAVWAHATVVVPAKFHAALRRRQCVVRIVEEVGLASLVLAAFALPLGLTALAPRDLDLALPAWRPESCCCSHGCCWY